MADRFPSIEDFDEGQTEARGPSSFDGESNFLDRERAVLGEDADQFTTPQDYSKKASIVEDDNDLLGGEFGEPSRSAATGGELDEFESAFPAIDTQNKNVGPGGGITDTVAPVGYTNYNPPSQEEDTEPIRRWREKRDADLARRDQIAAEQKEKTVKTAREDIDTFYENYNVKIEKQKAQTRREADEFLKNRDDTTAGGTSWERIAKLADLSGKGQSGGGEGSTKKRMRELLLTLKNDKDAPGASGV